MTLEQEIICVDSKLFVELDESKSGHVHFGDTFKIRVKDKSKILICLKNGKRQV